MTNTTSRRKIAGLSAETYSEPCQRSKMKLFVKKVKGNESRYISLFAVTESIKKLFSIDHVNIYLFSIFFSIDFPQWKSMVLPHFAYFVIQSLTISAKKLILDIWQGSKHSSGLDGRRYLINIYLFRVRLRH